MIKLSSTIQVGYLRKVKTPIKRWVLLVRRPGCALLIIGDVWATGGRTGLYLVIMCRTIIIARNVLHRKGSTFHWWECEGWPWVSGWNVATLVIKPRQTRLAERVMLVQSDPRSSWDPAVNNKDYDSCWEPLFTSYKSTQYRMVKLSLMNQQPLCNSWNFSSPFL